jgi:hypothetical protein
MSRAVVRVRKDSGSSLLSHFFKFGDEHDFEYIYCSTSSRTRSSPF